MGLTLNHILTNMKEVLGDHTLQMLQFIDRLLKCGKVESLLNITPTLDVMLRHVLMTTSNLSQI